MRILGLESSCDETAAAVVEKVTVRSSVVASQLARHAPFGGVVPEIAAREHLRNISPVVQKALQEAAVQIEDIEAIAVTQGPGLIGALLVAISYAKGLATALGRPLIPVDHVHAHIHGALLGEEGDIAYPLLALVVSGGHTNLYSVAAPTQFSLVAHSLDDACGECFDKVGKLLGLPYPGGPAIERRAQDGDPATFLMPMMVEKRDRLAFSYSGLKTHVANLVSKVRARNELTDNAVNDICAAFQEAAFDQITRKLIAACNRFPAIRTIVIAGGVAANQRFRDILSARLDRELRFPPLAYCSDNAAMIAALGYFQIQHQGAASFSNLGWDAYTRHAP